MIRLALLLVLLVATPSFAAEEETAAIRVFGCTPAGICLIPGEDVAKLLLNNNANYDRAEKAEAELAKLKEIKGCAKLEVTEPSKQKIEIKPDPKTLKRG